MEKKIIKRFFNLRPAVFVAVAICFAIVSAYFFVLKNTLIGILFCLLFLVLCSAIFLPCFCEFKFKSKIMLVLFMTALYVFCGANFAYTVKNFDDANLDNHYFNISAKVLEFDKVDSGTRLVIGDLVLDGVYKGKSNYKSYLYVTGNCDLDIGDNIQFSTYLYDKNIIFENELALNDIMRGIKYTASISSDEITLTHSQPNIFERVHLFLRNSLDMALDGDEFAVAYALLTGNGENMDYETISSYRMAGVAHIFAVSGLHIGFLASSLAFVFDKLKLNRLLRAILTTLALVFYSGICGFSSSSLRAVVMTAVSLFASVKGNRYDGLTSISVAASIILTIFPVQFFNVGFQLSFIVVLGMMLLTKPLTRLLRFLPEKFASTISVVVAAQIASIPISVNAFGYFSPIAIVVNIIFLPAVSVIFIALLLSTVIGGIFNITAITLFIPKYILMFVNMCITAFDFEKLIVGGFSFGIFTLFYYLATIFASDYINLKKFIKFTAVFICTIVCVIGSAHVSNSKDEQLNIYVCGSDTLCATIIDSPNENLLIVSSASHNYSISRLNRISQRHDVKNINTVVFLGGINVDMQEFLTKLRTVFTLNRICYYGEEDLMQEKMILESFGYSIYNFYDGENLTFDSNSCCYQLGGNVVDLNIDGVKTAIFSAKNQPVYAGLKEYYDVMICDYQQELIFAFYNPKTAVSYCRSTLFVDGETNGTAILSFN